MVGNRLLTFAAGVGRALAAGAPAARRSAPCESPLSIIQGWRVREPVPVRAWPSPALLMPHARNWCCGVVVATHNVWLTDNCCVQKCDRSSTACVRARLFRLARAPLNMKG